VGHPLPAPHPLGAYGASILAPSAIDVGTPKPQKLNSTREHTLNKRANNYQLKTVNFDVGKNRPKLIAYHGNVPLTTVKLMAVF